MAMDDNLDISICDRGLVCEESTAGLLVVDEGGYVLMANNAASRLLGKDKSALLGNQFGQFDESQGQTHLTVLNQDLGYTILRIDITAAEWKNTPVKLLTIVDVTEEKKKERLLLDRNDVFKNSHMAVVLYDRDMKVVDVNQAYINTKGYSLADVKGTNMFARVPDNAENARIIEKIKHKLITNGFWQGELEVKHKNGDIRSLYVSILTDHDAANNITGYTSIATDLSEQKLTESRLYRMQYYDPLTELPNRLLLVDRIQQAILKSKRYRNRFALFMCSIRGLRGINDAAGHEVGDEYMMRIIARIRGCLRQEDTLARWEGNEFIILVDSSHRSSDYKKIGDKIIDAVNPVVNLGELEIVPNVNIGVVVSPDHAVELSDLLRYAEIALHQAEAVEENLALFYEEMASTVEETFSIRTGLHHAAEKQELQFYLQPIFKIRANRAILTGAEALVRWQHPQLGLIPPDRFIAVAERSRMIYVITDYMLEQACQFINKIQKTPLANLSVSVNITAQDFRRKAFIPSLVGLVKKYRVQAEQLCLELTESAVMQEQASIFKDLTHLRDIGVYIAIDDFGTGYSSFSYLTRLPANKLKIDKSFVDEITSNPADRDTCKAIIGLARLVEMQVVAEGVETAEQAMALKSMRCNEFQGYLFSKPLPVEAFYEKYSDRKQQKIELTA